MAIVDNEDKSANAIVDLLGQYIKKHPERTSTYEVFHNADDFLESDTFVFDAVFMDIDMPGKNGMEASMALRKVNTDIDIVFVTNLPQFAIAGYKVQALDFIVKPVSFGDFSLVLDKIYEKKEKNIKEGGFTLKANGILKRFQNKDVIYIEMIKHDVLIHESGLEPFRFRGSLKSLEPLLDPDVFVKINSGIIVNLSKVKSLGEGNVILEEGITLPISRSHKKDFGIRLSDFYGNHLEE